MNWFKRLFGKKGDGEIKPPEPWPRGEANEASYTISSPVIPGKLIIARQGGQKRNRIHIYERPCGYPIRLCDWTFAPLEALEVLGEWDEENARTETKLENALLYYASSKGFQYCRHCMAVVQGKRGNGTAARPIKG